MHEEESEKATMHCDRETQDKGSGKRVVALHSSDAKEQAVVIFKKLFRVHSATEPLSFKKSHSCKTKWGCWDGCSGFLLRHSRST